MTGNTTTQREVRLAGGTVGTELAGIGSVIRCDCINRPLSRRGVARHCRRIADRPCLRPRRDAESRLRDAFRREGFSGQVQKSCSYLKQFA